MMKSLRNRILHIERAVLRGYDFVLNVHYYYTNRRYGWRRSIELAKSTL